MRFWTIILIVILLGSCEDDLTGLQPKRSDSTNALPSVIPTPTEVSIPSPAIPLLVAPENNNTCTTEEPIDDQNSNVTFRWRESNNTSSYELNIEATGTGQNFKTSKTTDTNAVTVVLERGLPYSWWVVSKSSSTQKTAKSAVWAFYLENNPNESHVPFPASLKFPENNTFIMAEKEIQVRFEWEGNDLDNDIAFYEFQMGRSKDDLTAIESDLTQTQIDLMLETDQEYYWQIHTRDQTEHVSTSEVYRLVINSKEKEETDSKPIQTNGNESSEPNSSNPDTSQSGNDPETPQTSDTDSNASDENTRTITLEVIEDTWLVGRNGSSKSIEANGTANTLVSSTGDKDDDYRRFLLKFSLGDIQVSTIKRATLHLTADRDWTKAETAFGGATTQQVYHVLDDRWMESDLNANTEPSFDTSPITTFTANSTVGNAKEASPPIVHQYDITNVFDKDTDGIVSLRITTGDTSGQRITYFSKDSATNIPKLVIEVSP